MNQQKFVYASKKKRGNNRPSLEDCIEQADCLAQQVENEWAARGGDAAPFRKAFKALLALARKYRTAKQNADSFRAYKASGQMRNPDPDMDAHIEQEVAKERAPREAFARAYKEFRDKHEDACGK